MPGEASRSRICREWSARRAPTRRTIAGRPRSAWTTSRCASRSRLRRWARLLTCESRNEIPAVERAGSSCQRSVEARSWREPRSGAESERASCRVCSSRSCSTLPTRLASRWKAVGLDTAWASVNGARAGWHWPEARRPRFSGTTYREQRSIISTANRPVADFHYELPQELIAQSPVARRDGSRLMVLDADATTHREFADLPEVLQPGDVLVLNETRVIRARLLGRRLRGGGRAELLLLHPADSLRYDAHALAWIALARPARRLRAGERVAFGDFGEATVRREMDEGLREIELSLAVPFEEFLERAGRMPLPPYIRNDSPEAQARYQTVFAREPGSVAAPTASLHFTPELLGDVERAGIEIERISLDVGLGTFRPVTVETVADHAMHAEAYSI